MMRLKSEIWVQSYLRSMSGRGLPGYVVRRGDNDAGAIFIRINRLDGTSILFGPAPAGLDAFEFGRGWVFVMGTAGGAAGGTAESAVPDEDVEAYLREEIGMDPDIWVVEIEDREGRHFLEEWLVG